MIKCKLGDLFKIQQGFAFKSERYLKKGKYALCTLGNISSDNNFKYDLAKANYYPDDFPKNFILKEGDLIIPLTEQTFGLFGNTAFVPKTDGFEFVLNQRVGKVVQNANVDKYYLHYLLSTELVRNQIEATATGTSQRNTSPESIYDVIVWVHSYEEQKIIGKLLYDLERKVNNNIAINNNLLQIATSLFDYSFAKRKPNGKLSDIVLENPKSSIQVNNSDGVVGEYPFFTSGETINEWNSYLVDDINCYLSTGGNATIKVYDGKAAYSTDTWCIHGKDNYSSYLYFYLKSIIKSINSQFFAGSGLKHLQKGALLDVKLYIPSIEEIDEFNKIVNPILNKLSHIYIENKNLIKQRDFLLPLLMNGQATIDE